MIFFKKKEVPLTDFFPEGFVDIHSHLLPGIDDGAKDLEDAIALISKMRSYGIKNFITTPHVLGDVYPNSSKTIKKKLQEVNEELIKRNITDVSIRAAAEYMLDEQFSKRLENDDILTLKDNFILVEMSYFSAPLNLFDLIFEIQLKGYKPILAHPERYPYLADKGITEYESVKLMRDRNYFGSMMVEKGEADAFISGLTRNYPDTIRPCLEVIGRADNVEKVAGMYVILSKRGPMFFADTTVNINPTAEDLIGITLQTYEKVKQFNIEPALKPEIVYDGIVCKKFFYSVNNISLSYYCIHFCHLCFDIHLYNF